MESLEQVLNLKNYKITSVNEVKEGKTISNKLEQKILKDLLNYNLSIAYIAKDNGLSPGTVKKNKR